MRLANKVVLAAAGAGKTTDIVQAAIDERPRKTAIVTFTLKNADEIRNAFYKLHGCIPAEISVIPWLTFMLHEMARPYQRAMFRRRIRSVNLIGGKSAKFIEKVDIERYYFDSNMSIYTDKISLFAISCDDITGGAVIRRLSDLYDNIFIDEMQDLAGYDLDIVEKLLRSKICIRLVGDVRQCTYTTNHSSRHKQFIGAGMLKIIERWKKAGLCEVEIKAISHRSVQSICDLGDSIFPKMPRTESKNDTKTGHDGVFVVSERDVAEYVKLHCPQVLRLNRKFLCQGFDATNFGESKGLGFNRVLIFPYTGIRKWIQSGDGRHIKGSAAKVYVAVTRARQSVAFVFDGAYKLKDIQVFEAQAGD